MAAPMWSQGALVSEDAGAQWAKPGPWQTVVLDSEALPGKAEVIGGASTRNVDVKRGAGRDGAGITDRGLEPARLKIRVTLWTDEHLAAWEQRLPKIQPRAGKGGMQRAKIYHPALAMLGITEVCIVQVTALQPGSVQGTQQSEIDCLQFLPRGKDATKTIKKSTPSIADLDGAQGINPEATHAELPSVAEFGPHFSTPDDEA